MDSEHGGNIWPMINSGRDIDSILDFSSNMNEFSDPADIDISISGKSLRVYPEDQPEWLLEKLSSYTHAGREEILVGPGLTHFIHLLGDLNQYSGFLITSPAFSEYERTCMARNITCSKIPGSILSASPAILNRYNPGVVVITRPDNPTGSMIELSSLRTILETAENAGANVFIDEAFIDFTEDTEFLGTVSLIHEFHNLILGRSLTKILAMPSLRVGYLISSKKNLDLFRKVMEPWTVGQDHLEILRMTDMENIKPKASLVMESRDYLIDSMRSIGFEHVGDPRANYVTFRLREDLDPDKLLRSLESEGMLIRSLWNYPFFGSRFIRIAVKSRKKTNRLLEAMRRVVGH